jgi:hypothetical protein
MCHGKTISLEKKRVCIFFFCRFLAGWGTFGHPKKRTFYASFTICVLWGLKKTVPGSAKHDGNPKIKGSFPLSPKCMLPMHSERVGGFFFWVKRQKKAKKKQKKEKAKKKHQKNKCPAENEPMSSCAGQTRICAVAMHICACIMGWALYLALHLALYLVRLLRRD